MKDLTLLIPAKKEKESLPQVLNEIKNLEVKILIVLEESDHDTINSIKEFNCEILHQKNVLNNSNLDLAQDQETPSALGSNQ